MYCTLLQPLIEKEKEQDIPTARLEECSQAGVRTTVPLFYPTIAWLENSIPCCPGSLIFES